MINCIKEKVRKILNNMDGYHDIWYQRLLEVSNSVDVEECLPRHSKISVYGDNTPADNAKDYYKRTTSIPLLNHLKNQLDDRFNESSTLCVEAFKIVPAVMLSTAGNNWKSAVQNFVSVYINDMPFPFSIDAELDIWHSYWSDYHEPGNLPLTIISTLQSLTLVKSTFPNIYTILKILAVMPLTSCECERTISRLRLLKTYTRNTMSQKRFNGLALLYIHKNIEVTAEEVLRDFSKDPRRLDF